ncbi:MAG: ABC transporter ATP-binding protein [Campylobacterota bacterium]|nr:ABC transporter ATP-binding protein [Campylobacterota bacterium]
MTAIDIKNLTFNYEKDTILENINLKVEDKDFLAVIGPNGGGKSTLLKLILGINETKKGQIHIYNKEPKKNLSHIGYVPQNTNINTDFPIKVIEVVLMGHVETQHKRNTNKIKKFFKIGYDRTETACAMGALAQVGMEKYANKKIGSLSGGQRQRVMIARALCAHPSILILDEPTASIDVSGQKQIYDLLKELNKSITIILVSHDISIIMGYANKVAHINKTINFHDISNKHQKINNSNDEHFCEVEMLEMLGSCKC